MMKTDSVWHVLRQSLIWCIGWYIVWCWTGQPVAAQPAAGSLELRRPVVPESTNSQVTHPIDRFVAAYRHKHNLKTAPASTDLRFARRVWLDLQGILPPQSQLADFLADKHPHKRQRLIQRLLADRRAFADHWLTFWNDALRNAYQGTGFIDDGRRQITGWLYKSLYDNKPYDQFVRELINPVSGSEGFVRGVVWRGVINASQRREMQAAQNIGQVFLGTNLKCASCHDSFINDWKSSQIWALASVFAQQPLEIHRCDKPTGEFANAAFLYPSLGTLNASQNRKQRLAQLSQLLTSPRNGRFSRTIVNRIWAQLLGRGLIEPVDEMDHEAWQPELLDWMAADLVDHDYNLKHLMQRICTSRAYQARAVGAPQPDQQDFVFTGPLVKRMSAEQFADAVSELTQDWPKITSRMQKRDGRGQGGQATAIQQALREPTEPHRTQVDGQWIWNTSTAAKAAVGGHLFLRKSWRLSQVPDSARVVCTCDNQLTLFVNGRKMASSRDWNRPVIVDIADALKPGVNVLAVDAANWPLDNTSTASNPAGLYLRLTLHTEPHKPQYISSDTSWVWSLKAPAGWSELEFDDTTWKPAVVIAAATGGPWNLGQALSLPATDHNAMPIRAAWTVSSNLLRALGRPNREQVVTRRDSWATTLQGLELTNGATLNQKLAQGAQFWASQRLSSAELISKLYLRALSREPTQAERATSEAILGTPVDQQGLEDLLWVLVMLDEFQLIY